MNILDDEFRVSRYINNHRPTPADVVDNSKQIEEAIAWSKDAMRTIIIPSGDLDDLERQWIEFNCMLKKHRRESDWKALELFGKTNQELYEDLRSSILRNYDIENEIEKQFDSIPMKMGSEIETWYDTYKDIHTIKAGDIPVTESYIDDFSNDPYYTSDAINYTSLEVEKARKWADESNRVIVIPTRTLSELESIWDAYSAMHHKHCRESDWMSLELFGVTNLKHYEYLKNQFLQQDISVADSDRYGSVVEYVVNPDIKKYFVDMCKTSSSMAVVKTLLELAIPTKSVYEDHVIGNVIDTTIDTMDDISQVLPNMMVNYGDLPYFTPEDMIDMGVNEPVPTDNFFGVSADNTHVTDSMSTSEWFEMYKATFNGFHTEYASVASDWVYKVRTLMHGLDTLKESGTEEEINARKQSILELGWNPDIKFDDKARKIAKECTSHLISNKFGVTRVVDLRGFRASKDRNFALYEDTRESLLHPIYVILTEGKSAFSGAIKGITKSIYSHVSIAFDVELKHMYSFGIENKTNKSAKGGFREEDIKDTPEGGRVNVFAFFVGDEPYKKIIDMVENLKENINKTAYGYKYLFAYLFKIPMNTGNYTMFCSQFVDSCLKAAGIDITGKKPIFVAPEDINKAAKNEKRIYNLYSGLASNYNWVEVKNLIDSLSMKAVPLKEHNVYFDDERSYITGIISNIHNATFLREMSAHSYLVKDKNVKRLLEEKLFDNLTIRDYMEGFIEVSNNPTLNFLESMIINNYCPI